MDDQLATRMVLALESLGTVVITDAEGRYIYASPKRLQNENLKSEDLIGKYVRDINPDTLVNQVIQTRIPVTMHPMRAKAGTPDGSQKVFVSYYPLIKDDKCIGCFLYTSFYGLSSAMEFSHLVSELSQQLATAKKQLQTLKAAPTNYSTADIIGQSHAVSQLKLEIAMVARTASNVLIFGETGTGKELVAHSIHSMSNRFASPFVRVNCSAIPEHLMESEFFGYEEGAFTGAKKGGKPGKFERASGGSLFLDEINTLPISMQPKFLRVLQEGEVERVGGNTVIPVNTRVISATNAPLEELVLRKGFRQDLYYRLNVVQIKVPPLRERKEDIPLLVNTFISQLNVRLGLDIQDVHPMVLEMLMDYDWPGNIRELQNVVERAMNFAYEGTLSPAHFKFFSAKRPPIPSPSIQSIISAPAHIKDERSMIIETLQLCRGNKKAAAQQLGWARSTLYEKMRKYQINPAVSAFAEPTKS